eukprot:gene12459-12594_t
MSVATPELQVSNSAAGLGRITLCRERQLNALGAEHVEALQHQLQQWAEPNSGVRAVLLDSSSAKAFCSGGDVKAARQAALDQPYPNAPPAGHHIHRVFRAEYSTVLLIEAYRLPIVACCQGIWMGLGFGLAGFCRYKIVTDETVFAMPENHIGLWPDVGFAWKAAQMPGRLGLFLGLTGVKLTCPADLLYCGIATHYMPSQQLQEFKVLLAQEPSALDALLQQHALVPGSDVPGPLQRLQPVLDQLMGQLVDDFHQQHHKQVEALSSLQDSLQQAMHHVQATDHEAAHLLQNAIDGLAYGADRSQLITIQHFSRVHKAVNCQEEYRMAVRQVAHADFMEGVRAALVDKDRCPVWDSGDYLKPEDHVSHGQAFARQQQQQLRPGNRFDMQRLFEPLGGREWIGYHLLH